MKRRVILDLWKVLSQLEGLKHDVRFSYFLAKNKVALKSEIEALNEANTPSAAYLEFENKRVEGAQRFADKDEVGNPKVFNNQYVITEHKSDFEAEMKKLKTKFKTAIEAREKQIKDYEDLLEEEVEFKPTKLRFSQLPRQVESSVLEVFIEADIIEDDQEVSN
jgi:hypothetical protein